MYYYLCAEARPDLPNLTHVMCKCAWECMWRIRKAALPMKKPLGEKATPTCGKAMWKILVAEAGQQTCTAAFLLPSFSAFPHPSAFLPPLLLGTPTPVTIVRTGFQDSSHFPTSTGIGTLLHLNTLGANPPVLSQYMLSTWWFYVQNTNPFLNQNMLSSFRIH